MPAVRARHLKTKLDLLSRWPGGRQALARIDAGIRLEVNGAHGMDWLPLADDIAITQAAHEALGPSSAESLWSELMQLEMDGLLFGPITRAALQSPRSWKHGWADLLCKGWQLAFRNCGRWRVRPIGPRALDLRLERLPEACVGDRIWVTSVASALSAVHRFLQNQGTFRLCGVEPPGTALYRSTWRASARLASGA
jgi:hypothetical protein